MATAFPAGTGWDAISTQVLEQQDGSSAPVHVVGNRQGNLRDRLIGGELIAGHPHQSIPEQAKQRYQARAALQVLTVRSGSPWNQGCW
jgi:hypothetical protein